MLTDDGLTYLARRDRAAVGLTLDRWSSESLYLNSGVCAGTALRALASQLRHHAGFTGFVVALSTEVARSPDDDLLPSSRSSIGYRYDWTTFVVHPDASFTLEHRGRWRPYLLEFERRYFLSTTAALTPIRYFRFQTRLNFIRIGDIGRSHTLRVQERPTPQATICGCSIRTCLQSLQD